MKKKLKTLPLVSIITPAYNREDLIKETIESVLNQKYPNLEYIVIDDGSKDNTLNIIKKYKDKVTIIAQKNIGETKTVNKGFSLAHGEIIAVINSDDPLLPGAIQKIVTYMEAHPEVLAVYPDWVMIDGNNRTIQEVHPADYNYLMMLREHYCIPGPGTFFRKEAIKLTGGRSLEFRYVADFVFWLKLGMYGPLYHLPKTLATFRVHASSQGIYARGEEMAAEHKKLVDWVYDDPDVPKEALLVKKQAYASGYFHAAKESTSRQRRFYYYVKALRLSPQMLIGKMKYELVKLKHRLIHNFYGSTPQAEENSI